MIALKSILVATDFGEASDAALAYGREMARAFGATLHVLHVADDVYVRLGGDGLPQNLYVNGYAYGRAFEMRPADGPQDESIVLGWRHTLTGVERVCAALEAFDPASVARRAPITRRRWR